MISRREAFIGLGSLAVGAVAGRVLWHADDMALNINMLTPDRLADSIPLASQGSYSIASPFARLVISTEATTLRLSTYNDCKSDFSALSKFGVWVNGAYLTSFDPAGEGAYDFYLGLDAGLKTVEFVAGVQSFPTGQSLIGAYLVAVTANKPMTQVLDVANDRLLIYGDSIAIGDGSGTTVQQSCWTMQVRHGFAGSVALEAWGYRSLKEDYDRDPSFAALVAKFQQINPTRVWLAIGTNDYGLNKWNAASFGAAYATLLDAIHAALPTPAIYAATPIVRSVETANASGSTTGDYRTEIASACSGRAWATLVDGTAFVTTSDLADGIHPNVAGHGKIATAVLDQVV